MLGTEDDLFTEEDTSAVVPYSVIELVPDVPQREAGEKVTFKHSLSGNTLTGVILEVDDTCFVPYEVLVSEIDEEGDVVTHPYFIGDKDIV